MAERPEATAPPAVWVADPLIAWRIVLTAELTERVTEHGLRERLTQLRAEQRWPGPGIVRVSGDVRDLRRLLGDERAGVVSLGLCTDGQRVVVSAHHSAVDGLGLLAVLAAVTGRTVASSARGVGDRPDGSGPIGTIARRLTEVAVRPPAGVAARRPFIPDPLDVYVERDVAGHIRTADLVVAGARGVVAHNGSAAPGRRRTRHVAVAVGVTRRAATGPIADHSALLRLRDVELLDLDAVTEALREQPTARAVQGTAGGARLLRFGLRALAPRLGSTLLVSHLGTVTAPGVESLTFHPVTAGGTGIALGAVTLGDATATSTPTTRVTLRARGTDWTHDGLEQLLEAVVTQLRP